jgi:hypothetical protein
MRKIIMILMLLLLTAAMPLTVNADDDWVPPPPPLPGTGIIRLVTPHNITLEAGETSEAIVTLRNVGTRSIRDSFTLAVPSANAPFSVEFLHNQNRIGELGANIQRTMRMRITVNENASPGNFSIRLDHFFSNMDGTNSNSSDTINVRIGGEAINARLEIRDMTSPVAPITVNQSGQISFYLHNASDVDAKNIRVQAAPESNVLAHTSANRVNIASLAAGESQRVSFSFMPRSTAETRSYTITFTTTFENERDGDSISFEQSAALNVFNPDEDDEDEEANLEIRDMTSPSATVNVGQTARFTFKIHNNGDAEVRNIHVAASSMSEGVIIPMTMDNIVIPSLAAGASREVSFSFSPTSSARTQSYSIRFNVSGGGASFNQFAAFNVSNPDDDDDDRVGQIPRVIVAAYSLEPAVPRAGQEFEMTITFRNTNATRSVNNISILMSEIRSFDTQGQQNHFAGFTPIGGSNTQYIESLAPRAEVTKTLRFITSADGTPGIHNMRVAFDYQDADGKTHTPEEQISIQLAQVMRLELANVEVPETGSLGSPARFSFRIINTGRVNLINMRVRTEGPFDVSQAGRFITPINSQRFAEFDGLFVPEESGALEGKFIVYGEDNTGELIEVEHPFTIFVDEGWGDGFHGGDWDGAWSDGGFGRPMPPHGGRDTMIWGEEESSGGGLASLIRNLFTRDVAPEWWDEEFNGPFNADTAAMMGIEPDSVIRGAAIAVAGIIVILIIVTPVAIIVLKKRSKLNFEDEE